MDARTAIIGIGNKLMGDEGVGVHAVEYLRARACHTQKVCHPRESGDPVNPRDSRFRGNDILPNVDLLDAGTGGMALFHLLAKYERVIIIDAADFGGRPGEVRMFVIAPARQRSSGGSEAKQSSGTNCIRGIASSATPPRNDIQLSPDSTQVSLHGTSLAGILQLAEKLGTKMPEITVIAVQPEYVGCKLELSPAVKRSLGEIAKVVGAIDFTGSPRRPPRADSSR